MANNKMKEGANHILRRGEIIDGQFAVSTKCSHRLLLDRLYTDATPRQLGNLFTERSRIRFFDLLKLNVWYNVGRQFETHLLADRHKFANLVIYPCACSHA